MGAEEFGRLTPLELHGLWSAWEESERRMDHRAAAVAAAVWNTNGGHNGQAVKAEDIFPHLAPRVDPLEAQRRLREKIRMAFGGRARVEKGG